MLVAGDLLIFSMFFIVLLSYRNQEAALFAVSQRSLDQRYGAFNTLLMLSSSLCVALGMKGIRQPGGPSPRTRLYFMSAAVLGVGFVIVKSFEWAARIAMGQTINSNDFFMFYFMYTGIHLLHVLVGLAVLTVLCVVGGRERVEPGTVRLAEAGGIYWHLVDLLWIILFALLYLLK